MKKWKFRLLVALSVIVALMASFAGGYYLGSRPDEPPVIVETGDEGLTLPGEVEKRVVTYEEIEGKLAEISELATYSDAYAITKVVEQSRYILEDYKIPGTTNTITISCEGIVKVGYDTEEISFEINEDGEQWKIYISLPEPKVLDNYVIWDSVRCEETNSILNPIDFAQYQVLISEIEADGLRDAEERGIYAAAEQHMERIIVNFLSVFGDYEVVFL